MKQTSLRQLARELGVSASYLSQIRHGKRPASERIANSLNVKVLSSVKQPGDDPDCSSEPKQVMVGGTGLEPVTSAMSTH